MNITKKDLKKIIVEGKLAGDMLDVTIKALMTNIEESFSTLASISPENAWTVVESISIQFTEDVSNDQIKALKEHKQDLLSHLDDIEVEND